MANASVPGVGAHCLGWDPQASQWYRMQGSSWAVLLAGQGNTVATRQSSAVTLRQVRGLIIYAYIASIAGVPTFTPKLVAYDPNAGRDDYWVAAAALSANGTYMYVIYPGASKPAGAPAGLVEAVSLPLPPRFELHLVYAGDGVNDKATTGVWYQAIV